MKTLHVSPSGRQCSDDLLLLPVSLVSLSSFSVSLHSIESNRTGALYVHPRTPLLLYRNVLESFRRSRLPVKLVKRREEADLDVVNLFLKKLPFLHLLIFPFFTRFLPIEEEEEEKNKKNCSSFLLLCVGR